MPGERPKLWMLRPTRMLHVSKEKAKLITKVAKNAAASIKLFVAVFSSCNVFIFHTVGVIFFNAVRETTTLFFCYFFSPDGVDGDVGVDVSLQLGGVHVGDVLEVGGEAVVLADEGVEDVGKVDVGVLVSGVDAAVLVVELNGAGAGLGQGEAGGLGDDVLHLVPLLLGDVLGHKAVLGLDVGELSRHGEGSG